MLKGSLSRSKNENKLYKDLYCTLKREVLIRFIQRNQGHKDSMMHEFSSSVNKVNKAVAKVRTIGDRLPLSKCYKSFGMKNSQSRPKSEFVALPLLWDARGHSAI